MNGDESENACAWDAAQASKAADVVNFIVVVIRGDAEPLLSSAWCSSKAGWLVMDCVSAAILWSCHWLAWMLRPTERRVDPKWLRWGGGDWQNPR